MDRSDRELLALLSVRIAAIMEDEVERAVLALPLTAPAGTVRFEALKTAGHDIASLSAAAGVVLRRAGPEEA